MQFFIFILLNGGKFNGEFISSEAKEIEMYFTGTVKAGDAPLLFTQDQIGGYRPTFWTLGRNADTLKALIDKGSARFEPVTIDLSDMRKPEPPPAKFYTLEFFEERRFIVSYDRARGTYVSAGRVGQIPLQFNHSSLTENLDATVDGGRTIAELIAGRTLVWMPNY